MPPPHPVRVAVEALCDHGHIQRAAAVPAKQLDTLSGLPVEEACKLARSSLMKVFSVHGESKRALLLLADRMVARARTAYPSTTAFLRCMYENSEVPGDYEVDPDRLLLFTGPAGTGKSQVLAALRRVFGAYPGTMDIADHHGIGMDPYHFVNAAHMVTVKEIIAALDGSGHPPRRSTDRAIETVGHIRYNVGTCLIALDELQFLTQGESNALVAKVLLAMAALPIPSVVSCNFSMVRRVLKRPPEEHHRYLGNPWVMIPDGADSEAWIELLNQYQAVLEESLDFRLDDHASAIWIRCAGWKRVLVELLVLSYRIARLDNRCKVRFADVGVAYSSNNFAGLRLHVEAFGDYALTGQTKSRDLICPLSDDEVSRTSEARSNFARAQRESIAAESRKGLLTPEGRRAVDSLGGDGQQKPKPAKTSRPRKTLDSLKAAGERVMAEVLR